MPPIVKSVELPNQVELPYVERGDPAGVPVVLLHGYMSSWTSFELVLPHLPESIHAYAVTQRGHGDASRPATGYRPSDFAADLALFMDDVDLDQAVLVGGSSGGVVARHFALDHPDRTLGLVFLGSPYSLRGKERLEEMWDSTISKVTDPVDPDFVRDFSEGTSVRPVPEDFLEREVHVSMKPPARVWRETMKGLLEDESFRHLSRISAPTLVLWDDQDQLLPRSDQEKLSAAIPGARIKIYPGGGHTFYWEDPSRVAADVVAFVEDL